MSNSGVEYGFAISRGIASELCGTSSPSWKRGRAERRVPDAPMAPCASEKHTSVVATVTPESSDVPRAMVLTACCAKTPDRRA